MNITISHPKALATILMLLTGTCAAAATAPQMAQPQFGNQDVEGLAEGRHVVTDCSVNWKDDDGKVYCFADAKSKAKFLKHPNQNLERARDLIAAADVQSTEQAMENFDSDDAETVVKSHINGILKANHGVFPLQDPLNGRHLKLAFDGIDFTRTIDGYGFFPDVKFHEQGDRKQRYLIDFWVVPDKTGLKIQETRIYKSPLKVDGEWKRVERQPIPWWWIPASEHPGHVAQKRGWEVMSAVEQHALQVSLKNHGIFRLKDDKTGKELQLKFVDVHSPVRRLDKNGHYFACTDFRVVGTKHQIYDLDFWVDEKGKLMSVDKTKVHKVPELKGGQWVQVPRYSWKSLGASHVVP